MATFDDVKRIGLAFPGVVESTSYGTPALAVRAKTFCRMWGDRECARNGVDETDVLVVTCNVDEKDMLVAGHPGVLFSTPHYDGYGAMLVRLADVDIDDLADWLEHAYRLKAPARLLRELDT